MSKAFSKETDRDEDDEPQPDMLPANQKNYITPRSYQTLKEEWRCLMYEERPKVVEVVSWAAGNGDRSENGDYIYGKKRLREIDRRIRYLVKRIQNAEIVDPLQQTNKSQVFFGATVTYLRANHTKQTVTIVGIDEADFAKGKINWLSPVAKSLMKLRVGDTAELRTPSGLETIEIVAIRYEQT